MLACANDGENKKELGSCYVAQDSLNLIAPPVSVSIVLGLYTRATLFSWSLKASGDKDACLVFLSRSYKSRFWGSGMYNMSEQLVYLLDAMSRCVFVLIYPQDIFQEDLKEQYSYILVK